MRERGESEGGREGGREERVRRRIFIPQRKCLQCAYKSTGKTLIWACSHSMSCRAQNHVTANKKVT